MLLRMQKYLTALDGGTPGRILGNGRSLFWELQPHEKREYHGEPRITPHLLTTRLGAWLSFASITENTEAVAMERPFGRQSSAHAGSLRASHPYTFTLLRADEWTKKRVLIGKTICDGRCRRRFRQ